MQSRFFTALAVVSLIGLWPTAARAQQPRPFGVADAVRTAVTTQAAVKIAEQQLSVSRARTQIAAGAFDMRYGANLQRQRGVTPAGTADVLGNFTLWQAGAQQMLRNGVTVAPALTFERDDISQIPIVPNRATVGLQLTQPLMRGRGSQAVTAASRAADIDLAATTLDVRQTMSDTAARTLIAYWAYVAAVRNLSIIIESENRARQLVSDMQTLIAGGNRPAADLKQVQANLADRTAFRLTAEHAVVAARENLGVAMGLPNDQIAALPPPTDSFPDVPEAPVAVANADFVTLAIADRADLESARRRIDETREVVTSAVDAAKPKFDMLMSAGYAGLDHGGGFATLFTPFNRVSTGPNLSLSFAYDWSRNNAVALGTLSQNEALRQQSEIHAADLQRTIASAVAVAHDDLVRSSERVRVTREGASLYQQAVDNEHDRLTLGVGTILDVVNTEERLTNSLLNQVSALQAYANAIGQMRYQTGTLLPANVNDVAAEELTTIPPVSR